jgi:UDP-galactopyranose mutase
MLESDSREIKALADFVYRKVFENYTIKQWGLRPEQLGPGVTGRVPVRLSPSSAVLVS